MSGLDFTPAPTTRTGGECIADLIGEIERLECALENAISAADEWEKRCRAAWSALYHIEEIAHQARTENPA